MNLDVTGHTALVLGADGAIGHAIAHTLGSAGARVVLASRNADRLHRLSADLASAGIGNRVVPTDITDDDALHDLVSIATDDGMAIAVNNAGIAHPPARLGDLDIDVIDRVLATTLRGTFIAMRHELTAMPDGGSIINVISSAGLAGAQGMAAYAAAKHGIVGLTRTAAVDYADRGIRVNAVAPSAVESGANATQPEEVRARIGSHLPLGRLATPAEVAEAVLWLASPAASFTTGAILTVDGGKGARGA